MEFVKEKGKNNGNLYYSQDGYFFVRSGCKCRVQMNKMKISMNKSVRKNCRFLMMIVGDAGTLGHQPRFSSPVANVPALNVLTAFSMNTLPAVNVAKQLNKCIEFIMFDFLSLIKKTFFI